MDLWCSLRPLAKLRSNVFDSVSYRPRWVRGHILYVHVSVAGSMPEMQRRHREIYIQ